MTTDLSGPPPAEKQYNADIRKYEQDVNGSGDVSTIREDFERLVGDALTLKSPSLDRTTRADLTARLIADLPANAYSQGDDWLTNTLSLLNQDPELQNSLKESLKGVQANLGTLFSPDKAAAAMNSTTAALDILQRPPSEESLS